MNDGEALKQVPLLTELLQALTDYSGLLSIELKQNTNDITSFVELLKPIKPYLPQSTQIIFHSFSSQLIQAAMPILKDITTKANYGFNFQEINEEINNPDYQYLYPAFSLLKKTQARSIIIDTAIANKQTIIPWTINNSQELDLIHKINLDHPKLINAIISDNPEMKL